ncbi:MAG: T9SS type A sorting domain-containing protein [Bacteroidia bacterium]
MPDYGTFTGVKSYNFEANNNSFYPNPASQKIKFKQLQNAEIEIYDAAGKKVRSGSIKENDEISISDFPQGLYLLRIKSDQKIFNEKLIIQR